MDKKVGVFEYMKKCSKERKRKIFIIGGIIVVSIIFISIKYFYDNRPASYEDIQELQNNIEETKKRQKEMASKGTCNLKILEVNIDSKGTGYGTVVTRIKNISDKDINYVKLNIYFKDSNGNIVKSDWTNDSSCIKPGAEQVIEKMVEQDGSWTYVTVQLAEAH